MRAVYLYILFPHSFLFGFSFDEDYYDKYKEETLEVSFGILSIAYTKITILENEESGE